LGDGLVVRESQPFDPLREQQPVVQQLPRPATAEVE
jgi:hypothetical protein